ncbi:hypothetical protein NHX12_017579, partial [Muraenolepis orangiensis]
MKRSALEEVQGRESREHRREVCCGGGAEAGGLSKLCQGTRSVVDYAIDIRTQARLSGWNAAAQCDVFLACLADYVKDELVPFDLPASLDGLIEFASRTPKTPSSSSQNEPCSAPKATARGWEIERLEASAVDGSQGDEGEEKPDSQQSATIRGRRQLNATKYGPIAEEQEDNPEESSLVSSTTSRGGNAQIK